MKMKKIFATIAAASAIAAVASVSAMAADYAAADNSVKYTVPTPDSDTQMTVLVVPKGAEVTDENIYYIDQDGTLSGTALLKGTALEDGTYVVKVGYYNGGVFTIVEDEFTVGGSDPAYKLGDVDESGVVDITDALWTAQSSVGLKTLTDSQKLAADVDKTGVVDITDALWIAQSSVGLREIK